MPIRIFSLPDKDLQYALNCMDICDLIALSLCSKRTKNLVKSSNRRIDPHYVKVDENCVRIRMRVRMDLPDYNVFEIFDSSINIDRGNGIEVWRKEEFAQKHWIAHFLHIFNEKSIQILIIKPISPLNTIKQVIPKCYNLQISADCSKEFTKNAFFQLFPIAEEMEFRENVFEEDDDDFVTILTLNLNSVIFRSIRNPVKLTLDDLLVLNIANLTIHKANITENELNRFLKLWKKGNHTFSRQKFITLFLKHFVNYEEVSRGINYEADPNRENLYRLKRADGKEMQILVDRSSIVFKFE